MEAATPGQPGDEVSRAEAAAGESDPTQAATPDQVTEPEGGPDSPPRAESPLDGQSHHDEPDAFAERPRSSWEPPSPGGIALAMVLRVLGPSE